MTSRRLVTAPPAPAPSELRFVSSGAVMLNLVLGGGWPLGRISNIVGDESSGKTLLAVEACANFAKTVKSLDDIRYVECESAYDDAYGHQIGMPVGVNPVDNIFTVEAFFNDLANFLDSRKGANPSLYVLDSLDALSSDAELARSIDEATYGGEKARKLSEAFRRLSGRIEASTCHLMIISQTRDKIGVTFGQKKTRTGGKALNFYASQILWLAEIEKIYQTVTKVKRVTGVHVKARASKNKVGMPYRDAELTIQFRYGIDDEVSMLNWLQDNGAGLQNDKQMRQLIAEARYVQDRGMLAELHAEIREAVFSRWDEIEAALEPPLRKYE